jgi:hypothetical protein
MYRRSPATAIEAGLNFSILMARLKRSLLSKIITAPYTPSAT